MVLEDEVANTGSKLLLRWAFFFIQNGKRKRTGAHNDCLSDSVGKGIFLLHQAPGGVLLAGLTQVRSHVYMVYVETGDDRHSIYIRGRP